MLSERRGDRKEGRKERGRESNDAMSEKNGQRNEEEILNQTGLSDGVTFKQNEAMARVMREKGGGALEC